MSKTYKGVDLKNALRHYSRPGMKKSRHLSGTTAESPKLREETAKAGTKRNEKQIPWLNK